ncbi:MAG: type 4a pilus biogenesis protein PilO [Patescibacteria group bacterium]
MRTSTKRILSIGLAGLFFIGILVVFTSLIKPEIDEIGIIRGLTTSKERLFENQKSAVSQVQKLIGEFQNIAKLQETVSLALPISEHVTQALSQFQSIAKQAQINLKTFSVRPLSLEATKQPLVKRLGSLEVDLNLEGSYANLKSFINFLETNVRITNITSFNMSPAVSSIGTNQDLYALSLSVDVFYQENK